MNNNKLNNSFAGSAQGKGCIHAPVGGNTTAEDKKNNIGIIANDVP